MKFKVVIDIYRILHIGCRYFQLSTSNMNTGACFDNRLPTEIEIEKDGGQVVGSTNRMAPAVLHLDEASRFGRIGNQDDCLQYGGLANVVRAQQNIDLAQSAEFQVLYSAEPANGESVELRSLGHVLEV